ncbi:MAG: L-lactate dehydrogenase [Brevundimonas sp.]|jgi:L-lactate dehydrogenase|uniref:L-lactate dehydrogenase n=1 Tax=Brevundimonas sp. TaxID=1871086 RepID=UPI000DB564E7|nr:L-lactate dehydrogenase [Brevundimonas sp.]PZU01452.1 MAG: L-lactate dehydrogenase [Brevundimonas sp.]
MSLASPVPSFGRIAIIGAGHVGATAAYAIMLRALVREIVIIDQNAALAEAEAADIADANALARPARVWAGDYADAASAGIAVITAGGATQGSQSRLSVAAESAAIVKDCVGSLMRAGFKGVLLVAANPVDLMTLVAAGCCGLPAGRVIGTGTLLDTSRLKQTLSQALAVAPASIEGLVLGEHGDSEVVCFSTVRIGGQPLDPCGGDQPRIDKALIARQVRDAGYDIVKGKGYTSYGVATAIVRICEAIIRDERAVLPVSTQLTGQYGFSGLCLSLPCIIGAEGVEKILAPELDPHEVAALATSAEVLRTAFESLSASGLMP